MADKNVFVFLSIICVNARVTGESTRVTEAFDTTTSDFINCLLNTTYYNGTQRTTDNGYTCKRWDSDVPINFDDSHFGQDESVEEASNYCRDPDNSGYLWCYIMDEDVVWDKCSTKCGEKRTEKPNQEPTTKPSKEKVELFQSDDDVWKCTNASSCEPDEKLLCIDTMSTEDMEGCKRTMCCYNRGCTNGPVNEYTGRWSNSITGTECLHWDSITTYQLDPDLFPDETLSDARNHCRRPFNTMEAPACFVTQGAWDYCGVPTCTELATRHSYDHDCYLANDGRRDDELCEKSPFRIVTDGKTYPGCKNCTCCQRKDCYNGASASYTGTWARTISGRECIPWMESTYAQNEYYMWLYGNQFKESGNFCRDFLGYRQTWCITRDPNMPTEYCSLADACPGWWDKDEPTAAVRQTTTFTLTFTDEHTASEVPKMSTKPAEDDITHYNGYSTSDVPKRSTKPDIEETTLSDEHSTSKESPESSKPDIDSTTLYDKHSTSNESPHGTKLPIDETTLSDKHSKSEEPLESTKPIIERTMLTDEHSSTEEPKENTKPAIKETTLYDEHSLSEVPPENTKQDKEEITLSYESSTSDVRKTKTKPAINDTTPVEEHWTSHEYLESTKLVIEETSLSDEYSTSNESRETTKPATAEITLSGEIETEQTLSKAHANQFVTNVLFIAVVLLLLF